MKKLLISLIGLYSIFNITHAQSLVTLNGSIKTHEGNAIPFVNILVLNSPIGTVSDADGNYSLNLPKGDHQIQFSALSFTSVVKSVSIGGEVIMADVTLQENTETLGEVVVTANKQDEEITKVPVAITLLTSKQLKDTRTWNTMDMAGMVPNLYALSDGGHYMYFSSRGASAYSYDPAVQVYIDDVPLFSTSSFLTQLYDVSRIEFLRGPQGTLYGRNAIGGVINIVTNKPTNITKGQAELSLGTYGQQRYSLAFATPIIKSKLLFNANFTYNNRDGYVTNTYLNTKAASTEGLSGGVNLQYNINTKWTLALNTRFDKIKNTGLAIARNDSVALASNYTIEHNDDPRITRTTSTSSLVLKHYGDKVNFTSISAINYLGVLYKGQYDYDYTGEDLYYGYYETYGKPDDGKTFYQELRFSSNKSPEAKLNWIAGMTYFNGSTKKQYANVKGVDTGEPDTPNSDLVSTNQMDKGVAVFGQATFSLTSKLQAVVGVRYDAEKRSLKRKIGSAIDPQPASWELGEKFSGDFNALTPKIGVTFRPTQNMTTYASYTKGFRAGGVNYTPDDAYRTYDPETSDNFEIGVKTTVLNDRLRFNTALFYTLSNDIQAYNTFNLVSFEGGYMNVGDATSRGIEVELTFLPVKGLQLEQNFGYVDSRYDDFVIYDYGVSDDVNYKNKKSLYTPNVTNTTAMQYAYSITGSKQQLGIFARIEYRYTGRVYTSFNNEFYAPAYFMINTNAGIRNKYVELSFWVRNLTNEKYLTQVYDFGGAVYGLPRMSGITLTGKF